MHRVAETGFELHRTQRFIMDVLDGMGVPYQTIANTGLMAVVEGDSPGPTVAIRADMDGLMIEERTGLGYASENEGMMHACGHDAHMAIALGVAEMLNTIRDDLKGRLKILFQPAEEFGGGAQRMMEEGCLHCPDVDALLTVHVSRLSDEIGFGQIGITYGPIMAKLTGYEVSVRGESAHVSRPHEGRDALRAAAEIVSKVMRLPKELDLARGATLSVTSFESDGAFNIIRDKAVFHGDVRTLDADDENFIFQAIGEIMKDVDEQFGTFSELSIIGEYPATVNDEELTRRFVQSAQKIVGERNIVFLEKPAFGSDDAAILMREVPGTYFLLGMRPVDDERSFPHHHPCFDVDEDILIIGAEVMATAVRDLLSPRTGTP